MSDVRIAGDDLVFLPLGGSGEIGMNLNLYGHAGKWLMVDLGMSFTDGQVPGVDLVFPDPKFIVERRDDLLGLILTHGHEDHIGAAPHLWPMLRCPIWATAFTAELVKNKLAERGLLEDAEIHIAKPEVEIVLGPFRVRYVPLAHSIAEGNGLTIETPAGTVFHTGDWKLDRDPIIGSPSTPEELTAIGDKGVLAMVGDSTNVFTAAESGSETAVKEALVEQVKAVKQRALITTFASNVARVDTIGEVAKATGRHLVAVGRSLGRVIAAAKATGYLQNLPKLVDEEDAGHLPRDKVLLMTTGCQGEPRAALSRIASGEHKHIGLTAGDTVIFSSKIIPGNELVIGALVNTLVIKGVHVITEKDAFVHVSGHPGRQELAEMYRWIRPEIAVPVHGEARHIKRHAEFAEELGVRRSFRPQNGDVIRLTPEPAAHLGSVAHGRLLLDGDRLARADAEAILERRRMMFNGALSITLEVDLDGLPIAEPIITAFGIAGFGEGGDVEAEVVDAIETAVETTVRRGRRDEASIEDAVRIAARRVCRQVLGKRPVTKVELIVVE